MDTIIGEIQLFPYLRKLDEDYWLPCDGRQLSIQTYSALFSLLGTQYGGNGTTTFALPNLQGAEPHPGVKYYIAVMGTWPPFSE